MNDGMYLLLYHIQVANEITLIVYAAIINSYGRFK